MGFRVGQVFLVVALAAMVMVAHSTDHHIYFGLGSHTDGGLIGDALDMDQEMMLESETARRHLAGGSGYVSYGALRKNNVPCNQRGQSYYNCRAHQKANPYTRGCTRVSKCARNNH